MASTLTKGLFTLNQMWILCMVLSLFLQITRVASGGSSKESSCSAVTLEKLESAPCKINQDVEVVYRNRNLVCGAEEPKRGVSDEPKFRYAKADKSKTYTLMMLDPDAPNHGDLYYRHWLIADISGENLANGNIKSGRVITAYTPPTPPEGTGVHRYQFFVLVQSDVEVGDPPKSKGRFDAVAYSDDNGLCGPVAAFEFKTAY